MYIKRVTSNRGPTAARNWQNGVCLPAGLAAG